MNYSNGNKTFDLSLLSNESLTTDNFSIIPINWSSASTSNESSIDVSGTISDNILSINLPYLYVSRLGSADGHACNCVILMYHYNKKTLVGSYNSKSLVQIDLDDGRTLRNYIIKVTKMVVTASACSPSIGNMIPYISEGKLTINKHQAAWSNYDNRYATFDYDIYLIE